MRPPLKEFALQLGIGAWSQKTRMMGLPYQAEKKFDDIFSRLDTIHERNGWTNREMDRQTDGRTPTDIKDRAYAWRRVVQIPLKIPGSDPDPDQHQIEWFVFVASL